MKHDIVQTMRNPMILLMLLLFAALPAAAQSNREFGIVVGASSRHLQPNATEDTTAGAFLDDELNLSHNVVELFYGLKLDDSTFLKFKAGRIETPLRYTTREVTNADNTVTRFAVDEEGEVHHADVVVEYRFSEAFGSTSLFAGIGGYRASGDHVKSEADWGYQAGVNADFPITRHYGILVEGAYHWTHAEYRPKYLTLTGGVRFSF